MIFYGIFYGTLLFMASNLICVAVPSHKTICHKILLASFVRTKKGVIWHVDLWWIFMEINCSWIINNHPKLTFPQIIEYNSVLTKKNDWTPTLCSSSMHGCRDPCEEYVYLTVKYTSLVTTSHRQWKCKTSIYTYKSILFNDNINKT